MTLPITAEGDRWLIEDRFQSGYPDGWEPLFESLREKKYFSSIQANIDRICQEKYSQSPIVVPSPQHLFRAYELVPPEMVKVVIIGQDPYPTLISNTDNDGNKIDPDAGEFTSMARGLSFSVHRSVRIPKSLQNIFSAIKKCFPDKKLDLSHGDLSYWSEQGVMLLNMSLATFVDNPDSQGGLWDGVLGKTIEYIVSHNRRCIFVLWGGKAKRTKDLIKDRGIILEGVHPAERKGNFLYCDHFKQINSILESRKVRQIDWQVEPPPREEV